MTSLFRPRHLLAEWEEECEGVEEVADAELLQDSIAAIVSTLDGVGV